MGRLMCDFECSGYYEDPNVGDLWPGETEEEFGYPAGSDGTREAVPESIDFAGGGKDAEIARLKKATHHPICNYWKSPFGDPGCICALATKRDIEELTRLRAPGEKWIDVKQKLPEEGTRVLAFSPARPQWTQNDRYFVTQMQHYSGKVNMFWFYGDINRWATHWQPLPAPPKDKE